jgi:hypothetical protein
MKWLIPIIVALSGLTYGCTSVSTFKQQDGTTGYEAYCSALAKQQCADRATQQCPGGYVVLTNPQIQSQSGYKLLRNLDDPLTPGSTVHLYFACK